MIYGYARCSTEGQDLSAQLEVLKSAGCEKVFAEKISGAKLDRRQLTALLKTVGPGETWSSSRGWIGLPGASGTCSTSSQRSAKQMQASCRLRIDGRTHRGPGATRSG
jgi:hypothetical protein